MFSLDHILALLEAYKYVLLFPLMIIEGPIITVIGAFLASLGYMNVILVYVLSLAGDIVGDIFYYAVGRWGGRPFLHRWGRYVGMTTERVERMSQHFAVHAKKNLVVGKLTHAIGPVILVSAGMARVPFLTFFIFTTLPSMPKSLLFVLIGYYFGRYYATIDIYLRHGTLAVILIFVASAIVYFIPILLRRLRARQESFE